MAKRPLSEDEREELTAYLDGEADPATRARIEARLNSDPSMRAEADSLKRAWDMLDHLPRTEPSPTFTTKTLDRLSAYRPQASTVTFVALPAMTPRTAWVWATTIIGGLVLGWFICDAAIRRKTAPPVSLEDPVLVRDLRLIENLPLYDAAESLDFLQALDSPDRFGAESPGP